MHNLFMSEWSRIDEELSQQKLTWKWLREKLGVEQNTMGHWKARGVPPKYHPEIADYLGKPQGWVSGHSVSVRIDSAQVATETIALGKTKNENNILQFQKNKPDELVIEQFDTGGSMGSGLLLRDQPGEIRGWTVSQEWLSKNIKSHSGAANLCIVTGFGDSMKGMFNSGDPLVIDRGVSTVEGDAVYFFRVDNEGFIKRLQRVPGKGLVVLSENKKYESWVIDKSMDFQVFGRVVKAWQGEDF